MLGKEFTQLWFDTNLYMLRAYKYYFASEKNSLKKMRKNCSTPVNCCFSVMHAKV